MREPRIARIVIAIVFILAASPISSVVHLEPGSEGVVAAQGNGNGNGNQNRSDVAKEKSKNDKNKGKKKKDKDASSGEVVLVEPYVVDVECTWDAESTRTGCEILGSAPVGGQGIGFVQVLESDVCAPLVFSDGEYVAPEPHTGFPGYRSREDKASLSIVLEGEVQVAGTATYWIKAGGNVFPVTGAGLECLPQSSPLADHTPAPAGKQEDAAPTVTPHPTAEPTAAPEPTGTLSVYVYTCTSVPEDTTGFDWFGACQPATTGRSASVSSTVDPTSAPRTADTDEAGRATFEGLTPATYKLELADGIWCHAKSDNVTPESDLVVEESRETSVYIFMCEGT